MTSVSNNEDFIGRIAHIIECNARGAGSLQTTAIFPDAGAFTFKYTKSDKFSMLAALGLYRDEFGDPPSWMQLLHPAVARELMTFCLALHRAIPASSPIEFRQPCRALLKVPDIEPNPINSATARGPWAGNEEWNFHGLIQLLPILLKSAQFRASLKRNTRIRSDREFEKWMRDLVKTGDFASSLLVHTELICGQSGRVYLDAKKPRICIRGPEDPNAPDLGYRWLEDHEVFSFFELRSSAQNLSQGNLFDSNLARGQIRAQLDTLIEANIRHAVLGAFGCGSFRNPADDVAKIYCEEISKRQGSFSIIAFAILALPFQADNAIPFRSAFKDF